MKVRELIHQLMDCDLDLPVVLEVGTSFVQIDGIRETTSLSTFSVYSIAIVPDKRLACLFADEVTKCHECGDKYATGTTHLCPMKPY